GRKERGKDKRQASNGSPGSEPGTGEASAVDPALVQQAIGVQERHNPRLMELSGVIGTGIAADSSGKALIKIYVESDSDREGLPAELDGVRVEAEVIGSATPIDPAASKSSAPLKPVPERPAAKPTGLTNGVNPAARLSRPVPIGVSTGNQGRCMTGSIACRLKDGSGNYYALSNNHIFALENKGVLDSAILQPGLVDTSCTLNLDNKIGTLLVYKQIFFGGVTNTIDAALARSSSDDLGKATPSDGYGAPRVQPVAAALGLKVKKYGKSTGLTTGTVTAINVTLRIGYSSGNATFVKQIIVSGTNFTNPGDSGSLLVRSSDNSPVGLLFAQVNSSVAVANSVTDVLTEFRKTIPTLAIDGN
ncbi:MAG TPA: hypothetical protein VL475_14165, partial [Planctomycetaceae bacterium]|nr:hypothetical protein [Planctomycetaceae bacterium]